MNDETRQQVEANKTDIVWIKDGMKTLNDRMQFMNKLLVTILLALLANIVTLIKMLG